MSDYQKGQWKDASGSLSAPSDGDIVCKVAARHLCEIDVLASITTVASGQMGWIDVDGSETAHFIPASTAPVRIVLRREVKQMVTIYAKSSAAKVNVSLVVRPLAGCHCSECVR